MTAKRTVLLVDDDPEVRKAFARLLRREGFEVVEARGLLSGENAIIKMGTEYERYHLITDYDLGSYHKGDWLIHFSPSCSRVRRRILLSAAPPDSCPGADAILDKTEVAQNPELLLRVLRGE